MYRKMDVLRAVEDIFSADLETSGERRQAVCARACEGAVLVHATIVQGSAYACRVAGRREGGRWAAPRGLWRVFRVTYCCPPARVASMHLRWICGGILLCILFRIQLAAKPWRADSLLDRARINEPCQSDTTQVSSVPRTGVHRHMQSIETL